MIKKIIGLVLILTMLISFGTVYGYESKYETKTIDNKPTKFITINMDSGITTKVLNAENNMTKAASLETMAKEVQAIAAINGTYFEAYEGNPIPWGTIIKDGKVIHISNGKSVAGITSEGKLIVDKLSFDIKGFVNGVLRSIPWRINHASQEPEAITIFTEEYGAEVKLQEGAKAAIIEENEVIELTDSDFVLSKGTYAVVYNPKVSYLLEERIKLGDEFTYEVIINTT